MNHQVIHCDPLSSIILQLTSPTAAADQQATPSSARRPAAAPAASEPLRVDQLPEVVVSLQQSLLVSSLILRMIMVADVSKNSD